MKQATILLLALAAITLSGCIPMAQIQSEADTVLYFKPGLNITRTELLAYHNGTYLIIQSPPIADNEMSANYQSNGMIDSVKETFWLEGNDTKKYEATIYANGSISVINYAQPIDNVKNYSAKWTYRGINATI